MTNIKSDSKRMTKEEFISTFTSSTKGKYAIESVKELEQVSDTLEEGEKTTESVNDSTEKYKGPEGIKNLTNLILNACFSAYHYAREYDHYENARKIDRESHKLSQLLEQLEDNPHFFRVKAEHFVTSLADSGITLIGDDEKIKPNLTLALKVIIESLRDSSCLNSGNHRSVIGSINYDQDLLDRNQKPDVKTMGLIYELALIIEYWKEEKTVKTEDQLMRQLDTKNAMRFTHYNIIAFFVNAALDKKYEPSAIKEKLKKQIQNNPSISYSPYLIRD